MYVANKALKSKLTAENFISNTVGEVFVPISYLQEKLVVHVDTE